MDITVNDMSMSENVGFRTTQFIQRSLQFFPMLGDLAIFFKTFLWSRGLNITYTGTIFIIQAGSAPTLHVY